MHSFDANICISIRNFQCIRVVTDFFQASASGFFMFLALTLFAFCFSSNLPLLPTFDLSFCLVIHQNLQSFSYHTNINKQLIPLFLDASDKNVPIRTQNNQLSTLSRDNIYQPNQSTVSLQTIATRAIESRIVFHVM